MKNDITQVRKHVSLGAIAAILRRPSQWLRVPRFLGDLLTYRRLEANQTRERLPLRLYPCLGDLGSHQSVHGYYFYQDCWAARQVFRAKPSYVVDVGSTVLFVGILSQFTPCVSVDIRPINADMDGLKTLPGSILNLPFKDDEVPCLTTMCVLEHVGLGRYGDPLCPTGTEDAAREIARVVAPGGIVVFSVPLAPREMIEFNANRRFTYLLAIGLFPGWTVLDSCLLTPKPARYSPELVSRTRDPIGCFCVQKPRL
jgi:SAM-dependent methyltransferase